MDEKWQCEKCTLFNADEMYECKACFAPRSEGEPAPHVICSPCLLDCEEPLLQSDGASGWSTDVCSDNQRRIMFIGRTGSGKSATGNNILNKIAFESTACGSSVTRKCQRGTAIRFGRNIQIIDSPGLFDTEMSNDDITRELTKSIGMTAPGLHAFVLVVRIDRFTKEENETVQHFKQVFGDEMMKYLIILFTRKDDLSHDNQTLTEYLGRVPPDLQDLAKACNNRCIAFNNRGSEEEREQDVQDFLSIVDRLMMENRGKYYTSEMYLEAEQKMMKREEQLRREHERKVEEERNAIRREFERKLKRQHHDHLDLTKQLQRRVDELEQEKIEQSKKENSGDEIASLCNDMKDLKLALKCMEKEVKTAQKKLEEERKRREQEVLERLEAEKKDFREEAREEINKEKSGFQLVLGSLLPSFIRKLLPTIGACGKRLKKFFTS